MSTFYRAFGISLAIAGLIGWFFWTPPHIVLIILASWTVGSILGNIVVFFLELARINDKFNAIDAQINRIRMGMFPDGR